MANAVRDNAAHSRFELDVDGHIAFSEYARDGDTIVFKHTEVPEQLAGRGVGSQLVCGALDLVRADGRKVVARCPFVAGYIGKHAEYADLLLR